MAPGHGPDRGPSQREGHTRGLFAAALAGIGGPQRVLLVGELWDRSPRRGLLQDFTRDMFGEPGRAECGGCPPSPGAQGSKPRAAPPERRLRAPLIFALFRLSAVQTPAEGRRLREILRDVRQRNGGRRAAVVGVIVLPPDPVVQKLLSASTLPGVLVPPAGPNSSGAPGPSVHVCALKHPPAPSTAPDLDSPAASAPLGASEPSIGTAPLDNPEPPAGPTAIGVAVHSVPVCALKHPRASDLDSPSAPLGASSPSIGSAPLDNPEPPAASAPLGAPEPLLLALLSSVFLPAGSQHPSDEGPLQTAVYQPGDPRSAIGVMEAACRALRAADPGPDADAEDELKIPTILKCCPWKRRRRRKGGFLKAGKSITGESPQHPEEGIALKALYELSNGACEESQTDT